MRTWKKTVIAGVCAAVLALGVTQFVRAAAADMLILPMRVYFKDGERMKGLTTVNTGNVQAIYRLTFNHKKQMPDGSYANLDSTLTPGYDPSEWLVYSPRQVDLAPQAKQGVRISLRRPADLPDGEYRVHAVLKRVARENIEMRGEDAPKGATATMMINVGFAIPVIIRKGKYDTTAHIKDFKMVSPAAGEKDQRARAELTVVRKGKYSSVGRLEAFWTPPGGGEEVMVSPRNSLIIFPEVEERSTKIVFDRAVQGGKLRVVYLGMEADTGVIFDEKTFTL